MQFATETQATPHGAETHASCFGQRSNFELGVRPDKANTWPKGQLGELQRRILLRRWIIIAIMLSTKEKRSSRERL
ncbi:hypothetical protein [Leisingera sp.]|uniref:hypothetical protein n=1 Tax=Leisingera sp. TaxID=1879318 RepID=UPI003A93BB59